MSVTIERKSEREREKGCDDKMERERWGVSPSEILFRHIKQKPE